MKSKLEEEEMKRSVIEFVERAPQKVGLTILGLISSSIIPDYDLEGLYRYQFALEKVLKDLPEFEKELKESLQRIKQAIEDRKGTSNSYPLQ